MARDSIAASLVASRSYQIDYVRRFTNSKCRCQLEHLPMGSGKTHIAAMGSDAALQQSFAQGEFHRRVVVVAPAGLLINFYNALLTYGRTAAHIERYYAFYSFEGALYHWQQFIDDCNDNIVVVDEIHELRTTITATERPIDVLDCNGKRPRQHVALTLTQMNPNPPPPPHFATSAASSTDSSAGLTCSAFSWSSSSSSSSFCTGTNSSTTATAASASPVEVAEGQILDESNTATGIPLTWFGYYVASGKKAAAVVLACQRAWKVMPLTGTLLVNSLADLANLAAIYDRRPILGSLMPIKPRKLARMKTLDEDPGMLAYFQRLFQNRISFLKQADVKTDMPSFTETNVLLQMTPTYYAEYARIENELLNEQAQQGRSIERISDETLDSPGAFWSGLRQVADELLGMDSLKRKFVLDLLKQRQWPMIISTNWVGRGIEPLIDDLKQNGYSYTVISGSTGLVQRRLAQKLYNEGKVQVILLTRAGSTGFDYHGTKAHVNLEAGWNEAAKLQASFRGIRVGSHKHKPVDERHVDIYNLYLCKPQELDDFATLMREQVASNTPGAPHKVLVVRQPKSVYAGPSSSSSSSITSSSGSLSTVVSAPPSTHPSAPNDDDDSKDNKTETGLPGIDLKLYGIQLRKAMKISRAYKDHISKWSTPVPLGLSSSSCSASPATTAIAENASVLTAARSSQSSVAQLVTGPTDTDLELALALSQSRSGSISNSSDALENFTLTRVIPKH